MTDSGEQESAAGERGRRRGEEEVEGRRREQTIEERRGAWAIA